MRVAPAYLSLCLSLSCSLSLCVCVCAELRRKEHQYHSRQWRSRKEDLFGELPRLRPAVESGGLSALSRPPDGAVGRDGERRVGQPLLPRRLQDLRHGKAQCAVAVCILRWFFFCVFIVGLSVLFFVVW